MIELPEAKVIAAQCEEILVGKTISHAEAGKSPHGFAWYSGDPIHYGPMLQGKTLRRAYPLAGYVEMLAGDMALAFHDGTNLRYWEAGAKRPDKHQLLVEFTDGSALTVTVQMYGGLHCVPEGTEQGFYYEVTKRKPSPLTEDFTPSYFEGILSAAPPKLSAKGLLATEQRIPGLGNGCLQDILWTAGIHPKRKISSLETGDVEALYHAVKDILSDMTRRGGRDTEKDLLGQVGGYRTVMSKRNESGICPRCGGGIKRMAYLGGNVYVCEICQK